MNDYEDVAAENFRLKARLSELEEAHLEQRKLRTRIAELEAQSEAFESFFRAAAAVGGDQIEEIERLKARITELESR